jgi:hypothetical protein
MRNLFLFFSLLLPVVAQSTRLATTGWTTNYVTNYVPSYTTNYTPTYVSNYVSSVRPTITYSNIAAMVAATVGNGMSNCFVSGYSTPNDQGGGLFTYLPSSTLATNLGTIFSSASGGRWARVYSGAENILWFGADNTGSAETASIVSNWLGMTNRSGTLYFPNGSYKLNNLVIATNNNVQFLGQSFCSTDGATGTWLKSSSTNPIITLGNDTANLSGVSLVNLSFNGGTSTIATNDLKIGGGGSRITLDHCYFTGGQTMTLVQGGTSYPVNFVWFKNCFWNGNNLSNQVNLNVSMPASGSQWTTAVYLDTCECDSGSTSGTQNMILDGTGITCFGTYFQMYNNLGILMRKTGTCVNASVPKITGSCEVDSANSTDVLIQITESTNLNPGYYVYGGPHVDGYFKMSDGNSYSTGSASVLLPNYSISYKPVLLDLVSFGPGPGNTVNHTFQSTAAGYAIWNTTYTGGYYRWNDHSGNALFQVYESGNISLTPANNSVYISNPGSGTMYLFLSNSANSSSFVHSSGNLSLTAPGDLRLKANGGANYTLYCFASNGVTVGASPTDPGADNLRVMGSLKVPGTLTSAGTTGNQTINKQTGTIRIAATGTTVTLTDSLITTSSIVLATLQTNDTTAKSVVAVPGSGSCVFTLNAASTGEVAIGFMVLNQ